MRDGMHRWMGLAVMAGMAALALGGCGGGGGGEAESIRPPLPSLSQDIDPGGERLDLRARNYFAMAAGNQWTYQHAQFGHLTGLTLARVAAAGAGSDVVISEAFNTNILASGTYRPTAAGWLAVAPFADATPAAVSQRIGDLLEYPEPFFAPGAERRIIRQGAWDEDLDGDGHPESFRLEIVQTLVGFETLTLRNEPVPDVAHFHTVATLTLEPSSLDQPIQSVVTTEDEWWAPGIGLVRAERAAVDGAGTNVTTPTTLTIETATVGGIDALAPRPDGTVTKIALQHNALAYDRGRNLYYASIPGSVAGVGNRIATIDAASGAVSYGPQAVGSEPWSLALSADGSALYVGLKGSAEVIKLRLPDQQELWRVPLPALPIHGQLTPQRIAVSMADPDLVAVATYLDSASSHAGVALIRDGVLQGRMSAGFGANAVIAFDGNGQYVYGFNNESSEFGLRRLAVLADGLGEEAVVTASLAGYVTRSMDWWAGRLVLDSGVYRTPDLAVMGQVAASVGANCRVATAGARAICMQWPYGGAEDPALRVVDLASYATTGSPRFARGFNNTNVTDVVPGPSGQVALRLDAIYLASPASGLWLFTSPMLP